MSGWWRLGALACGLAGAACGPALAGEVSVAVQDSIEEKLSDGLFSPQATVWHFDADLPYVSGRRLVCGWVNFQSAQQTYVGYHQFYAIMDGTTVKLAQIADPVSDVSGDLAAKLETLCGAYKRPA